MNKKDLVYYLYKDIPISSKQFRSELNDRFGLTTKEITDLYAKINNYQIDTYGQRIDNGKYIEHKTREEYRKINSNRRVARNLKLNNYETQKKKYREMI